MSYVSSLYHIVFATHSRKPVLLPEHRKELYAVMASIINKGGSKAYIINGIEDHVHILVSLSPAVALANLLRDLKSQSSLWIKSSGLFPLFEGWSKEYGAFSLSATHKEAVYNYILGQIEHHATVDSAEEEWRLVEKAGLRMYTPSHSLPPRPEETVE